VEGEESEGFAVVHPGCVKKILGRVYWLEFGVEFELTPNVVWMYKLYHRSMNIEFGTQGCRVLNVRRKFGTDNNDGLPLRQTRQDTRNINHSSSLPRVST